MSDAGQGQDTFDEEKLHEGHPCKVKLIFDPTDEAIELDDGAPIAEVCEEAGVPFACTEGVCGTCVIEVKEGMEHLTSATQEEKDFLGEDTMGERLACQCKIKCKNKGAIIRISF